METNDYVYPRQSQKDRSERERRLGGWIGQVRRARWHNSPRHTTLNPRRLMYLDAVNFAWEGGTPNKHTGPIRVPFSANWRNNIEEEEESED